MLILLQLLELFLFELTQQLNNLPKDERDRTREYYSEMIADRMEGGMDESEAVAALGDPESIARGVLQSWRELNASKPVPQQAQPRALSSVSIEDPSGDITVESGAEIGAYELQYENCSAEDYSLSEQDGALVIRYIRQKPEKPFSFFNMLSSRRLTVRLAGSVESLSVRTSSGDIEISDQNVNMLSLSSASGDMALHSVHCTADAMLSSASGNLEAQDFIAANAEIHTASGDISLEDATLSGDARIQTRSGEVKLEHLSADSLFAESVSGDLELSELRTANAIQTATVSGDVELRDAQAGKRGGQAGRDDSDGLQPDGIIFKPAECEQRQHEHGAAQAAPVFGALHAHASFWLLGTRRSEDRHRADPGKPRRAAAARGCGRSHAALRQVSLKDLRCRSHRRFSDTP